MRFTLFLSPFALEKITEEARLRSEQVGVPLTPADTARAILYRAFRLGPGGEPIPGAENDLDLGVEIDRHRRDLTLVMGDECEPEERSVKLRDLSRFLDRLRKEVG